MNNKSIILRKLFSIPILMVLVFSNFGSALYRSDTRLQKISPNTIQSITASTGPTPFLYLPFNGTWHVITSWFDHHFPNYKSVKVTDQTKRDCINQYITIPNSGGDSAIAIGPTLVFPSNGKPTPYKGTNWNVIGYDCPNCSAAEKTIWYDGHPGFDFGITAGTPIYAAGGGTIEYADCDRRNGTGCYIRIKHDSPNESYKSYYYHLYDFTINANAPWPGRTISGIGSIPGVGQHVDPGQIIAWSGNTGWKSDGSSAGWGNHLHFEVRHNGNPVDPWGWTDFTRDPGNSDGDVLQCDKGEKSYNIFVDYEPHCFGCALPTSAKTATLKPVQISTLSTMPPTTYLGGSMIDTGNPAGNDSSTFVSDITLPDGTFVSPNQSLTKTWRMKNTGTSTWGAGYKLAFVDGEQMGAPLASDIPSTVFNATLDLSIPLTSPAAAGEHTGYFQLRNPQGTYFGPKIWVKINVSSPSSKITIFNADPASPANTTKVRFHVRTDGVSNFRAMRILVDGAVKYELGAPDYYYNWDTAGYNSGTHSIVVEVANQTDTSWSHPDRKGMTYTLLGTTTSVNHQPNPPLLTSPYNWYVYYSGTTASLCAQAQGDPDGDSISAYDFEIHDSGQNWSSGWVGSTCVNTSSLPAYTYQWHVKVQDSRSAVSGWSQDFHFTIVNQNLSITSFDAIPLDGNSENIRLKACVTGQGGVGITIRFLENSAKDGTDSGYWTNVGELGVPCFTDVDAPIWHTLEDNALSGDGQHLVRVEAHGASTGWNGAVSQDKVVTLPHRRPSDSRLNAPIPASGDNREAIYLNSRSISFNWGMSDRASSYRLSVSTNPSPKDDLNPVFRQPYLAGITQATVNFTDDYPILYWQIEAINDAGSNNSTDQLFGIDRIVPTCSIQPLPSVSYENNFQVHWNGSDTVSGVGSYNIQYQDSRSSQWGDWIISVPGTKTYDLFIGQPGHTYTFRCQATDNAGNPGQYPSNGDTSITIDPASRPPEPWWNSGYAIKRNITVQNNMPGLELPANYPVDLQFTSGTTPSAAELYNLSQSSNKCDDLRIVYNNTTETNRYIKKCGPDAIDIWFRTQAGIPAGGTDDSYQIYLGNASATNPPADASQIWYPFWESDTTNLYLFQEGSGSTAYDYSGNGRNCTMNPSVSWSTSKWGTGLQLNHANNGSTISLTCGSPYPLSSLTAEFWFKPDINAFNADGRLAGQLGPSNQLSWLVSIESDRMKFERWCNGGSQQARGTINLRSPSYSQWNYLAVTFDGGSQVKFYVNGNLDNTVTLDNSCSATYNIPLEIGSVEDSGQGQYYIGAFRLSNSVKTNFDPGLLANITNEPTLAAGTAIFPPSTGNPDLAFQSINIYPNPDGGMLVEAVVKNQGDLSTQNGFYTDMYLNHVPTGAGDYSGSVRFWINDPIAAGDTVTLTTVITDLSSLSDAAGPDINSLGSGSFTESSGTLYGQVDSAGLVQEPDKQNNIYSSGVQICTATQDTFEGDGTNLSAKLILVGNVQTHNFDVPGDLDWIKFTAETGKTYQITTSGLGLASDTYLYLYDTNGTTLISSNDDFNGSLASRIEWTAPQNGTYFILIKHWNPNIGGCGTGYSIEISEAGLPPAAFIKTSPSNGSTNQPNNPTLNWEASSNFTNYEYCIDTIDDMKCNTSWISTGTNASAALSGLTPDTYYWHVRARNAAGITYSNGTYKAWWSFLVTPLTASFLSSSTADGWVLESSATPGAGGTINATGKILLLGDDASNKQFRSILSFNTTSLPDTAVITQVTLKVMQQSIDMLMYPSNPGENPFLLLGSLIVDINSPYFGSSVNLEINDFQAAASQDSAGTFGATPVKDWYTANLSSSAFPFVNLAGTTQVRMRFATGSNNNSVSDYLQLYSGNATTANRPVLIVKYYVP